MLEALHDLVKIGEVHSLGASSMKAREFSRALHLGKTNNWMRFIPRQDNHDLLAREEEREMLRPCADEGVQTVVRSPLAWGRLARPWGGITPRSEAEATYDARYLAKAESDRKVVEAVCRIAERRAVGRAQVAFAWLRRDPVIAAPIVGALKTGHVDDAVTPRASGRCQSTGTAFLFSAALMSSSQWRRSSAQAISTV